MLLHGDYSLGAEAKSSITCDVRQCEPVSLAKSRAFWHNTDKGAHIFIMVDSKQTGEIIKQARTEAGLSQSQLAERLNVSREAVSK